VVGAVVVVGGVDCVDVVLEIICCASDWAALVVAEAVVVTSGRVMVSW
jgi:hypothetical protein